MRASIPQWFFYFLLTVLSASSFSRRELKNEIQFEKQETLNLRSCGIASSSNELIESFLSDYWAQELIGVDLLKEELLKTDFNRAGNFISIFDVRADNHHAYVKNLISSEGFHSVLPKLNEGLVTFYETRRSEDFIKAIRSFKPYEAPSFINNSTLWRYKGPSIYDAFKSISPFSIIVTSSGNKSPEEFLEFKAKASQDFNIIIVGSFSPFGVVSSFSQSHEEVHILAPADHYIVSSSEEGELATFGGTSGATPLVTGSLAAFEWLSQYHPNGKDAKILLEKTAIPTWHSLEKPQRNGVGLLNTYRLGRVALRLKEKCNKSFVCFKKEIKNEENYQFSLDPHVFEDLAEVYPQCAFGEVPKNRNSISTCSDKKRVFNELRKQALLNPSEANLWQALSCIYRKDKFYLNGELFENIAFFQDSSEELFQKMKHVSLKNSFVFTPLLEGVLRGDQERADKILNRLIRSENLQVKLQLVRSLGQIELKRSRYWLHQIVKDENPKVRLRVALEISEKGLQSQRILNQLISHDSSEEVRLKSRFFKEGYMHREEDFILLKELALDEDVRVRKKVVLAAATHKMYFLLFELAKDKDEKVKREMAYLSSWLPRDVGMKLLKILLKDSSSELKNILFYVVPKLVHKEDRLKVFLILSQDQDRKIAYQAKQKIEEIKQEKTLSQTSASFK